MLAGGRTKSIENVFGLTWAASLSRMDRSLNALTASQAISISVSRSFRKRSIPLSSSSNHIGHGPFKKSTWPPKEARCTFRRETSMGLPAPDHTVPYGTVFLRTLSQALRARLRSVCPSGTGLQTVRNGISLKSARTRPFVGAKTQAALNLAPFGPDLFCWRWDRRPRN